MKSVKYDLWVRIFLIFWAAFVPRMALCSDCDSIERVQLESQSFFKDLRGVINEAQTDVWESTYFLPGSTDCEIEKNDEMGSSYKCTWYIDKGLSAEATAKTAYQDLLDVVLRCVSRPNTLSRRKWTNNYGERASVDDPYSNMPSNFARFVELDYRYFSNRWSVEFEYTIDENPP